MNILRPHYIGEGMGDCELCGAVNVGTRLVSMERTQVQACKRCTDKMGLNEKKMAPGLAKAQSTNSNTSGGYGGIGRKGKDIMLRGEKELSPNFSKMVVKAREDRGWDKRELARRMAEKLNVVNSVESGKRPTDSVIRKLERTLDIVLMVDAKPDENRQLNSGNARGLTIGDFLLNKKD